MKQILYVSIAVLTFAFVMALYYYLIVEKPSQQHNNLATVSNQVVGQKCNCSDLSFLNGSLFAAPTVKPPLRAHNWPLVVRSPYNGLEVEKVYSGVTQPTTASKTMALHADNNVGRK